MESIKEIKFKAGRVQRKSKKLLAFTIMTAAASALATTAKSQTFAEWFQQKSTQKKYLIQQIAALQVYTSYYKTGNNIAHHGLSSITGSLTSENGLHVNYYNHLQTVSPVIKNNKQVADILEWQKDILNRMINLDKTPNLLDGEKKYVLSVKGSLLKDCDAEISELQNVIMDGKVKMNDEERLKHIGVIHIAMQNNYRFASSFADQVKAYGMQKLKEKNNVTIEKKLFGTQ
jgi:hypothetical protein